MRSTATCTAGYGLTETAPLLTVSCSKPGLTYASDADRHRRRSMAGWPVIGMQVRVVDPEMNDVPRDMQTIGEVVTCGDHVMEGYFREPEATASVMSGPWFHTGDMAVWDEESFIQIVDRKKEIIISGGENISSIEVEKAIFAHPEVFECAVVAAPDERWGEIPAAIVVRKPGSTLTSEELTRIPEGAPGQIQAAADHRIQRRSRFPKPAPERSASWCCGSNFGRARRSGCKASQDRLLTRAVQ